MKSAFYIKDIANYVGKEIELKGWVYNKRSSGSLHFLQIRDGSGFIQATVFKKDVTEKVFTDAEKLTIESSVIITGTVREDKRAPEGYELSVKNLQIISLSEEFPIGKKEHGPDFLLSHRHLWLRSKRQWAILRIRNQIINSINSYLQKDGYTKIDSPMITPTASEGTTTLFELDYFGKKAYLSQSGQLYIEAAIFSLGKVYDFGPVLRAEKSKTRRHLVEFWMMDAEAAFMDLEQSLVLEENIIATILSDVLKNCENELKILERDTKILKDIKLPFPRITYDQAVKKLQELGSDIKWGTDFGNDDETILMNHYQQPLFVTHYPAHVKAFYTKKSGENDKYAVCADMLAPEGYGEVIGGGQREESYQKLLDQIEKYKYNKADYDWYLDLRKFGSVPHSGFGIGLERLVAWICKLDHVRETIPFPRMLERFSP